MTQKSLILTLQVEVCLEDSDDPSWSHKPLDMYKTLQEDLTKQLDEWGGHQTIAVSLVTRDNNAVIIEKENLDHIIKD